MTEETLKASWIQLKGALKQKYAKLTEQDLNYMEGKEEDLYLNLQKKLGKTRADLDHEFETIYANLRTKEEKIKAKLLKLNL
jgi:uncharacterized protein YjbJ (UPF0337 family)